jgi:hypothetical protein
VSVVLNLSVPPPHKLHLTYCVSMLASGTRVRGFKPGRSRRIFRAKNTQHAFLRRGSKAVCTMSQLCGMLKNPAITWKSDCPAKFDRPFLAFR